MALILSQSRLRLTQAKFFGNPQLSGSVTQVQQGFGVTLTPNPINAIGTIALSSPLPSTWNAGNQRIDSKNSNTDWFNVLAYGADPTGVADSAAAVQAAITDAAAVNGTVYFPTGTYKIVTTLTVAGGVTFRGDGWFSTFVHLPTALDGFNVTNPSFNTVSFYDIGFDTTTTANATAGAFIHGNAVANEFVFVMSGCRMLHQFVGLQLNSCYFSYVTNNVFSSTAAGGTDIILDNAINAGHDQGTFFSNWFFSSNLQHLKLIGAAGIQWQSNKHVGGTSTYCITATPTAGASGTLFIQGNSFEQTTTGSIVRLANASLYQTILIQKNEMAITPGGVGIDISPTGAGVLQIVSINGNEFTMGATAISFNPAAVGGADSVDIEGNLFWQQTVAAIQLPGTASHVSNLVVGTNQFVQTGSAAYIAGDFDTTSGLIPGLVTLFTQTANSTTTANTPTSLSGTGRGSHTLLANSLMIGQRIRIRASGFTGTADGGAAGKTITLYIGGVPVATGGTAAALMPLNSSWSVDATLTVRTTGAGGTCIGSVEFEAPGIVTARISGLTTAALNTTITNNVDVYYNNGHVVGSLTTTGFSVEKLG